RRAETGEIGPCRRLGEELTPHLVAAKRRWSVLTFLLLGGVREQRGHAHAETDLEIAAWYQIARFLLRVDHLVDRRQRASAPLDRPVQGGETRLGPLPLEVLPPLETFPAPAAPIPAPPRLETALLLLPLPAQ